MSARKAHRAQPPPRLTLGKDLPLAEKDTYVVFRNPAPAPLTRRASLLDAE